MTKCFYAQGFQISHSSASWSNFYYTRDHLGSIGEIVDSSGTLRARYDYDAWGNRTKISGDLRKDEMA